MAMKRYFTKRWLLVAAVVYVSCWLLTYFIGASQIRREIVAAMPLRPFSAFTDVSVDDAHHVAPAYYCRIWVYAPFLIYADYGWWHDADTGGGATALYAWIFGGTVRVHEFHDWMAMIYHAWPNKSPEPTAVGACSSAIAVHVTSRRWLSFLR